MAQATKSQDQAVQPSAQAVPPAPPPQPIRVLRYSVRADRIVADIALSPACPRYTSPVLAKAITQDFPNLPQHACVNDCGKTFAAVINNTPIPHLLEHMVVDLQVRRSNTKQTFIGTSEWVCEGNARARVEVSFADDLVALAAFRDAIDMLNAALQT